MIVTSTRGGGTGNERNGCTGGSLDSSRLPLLSVLNLWFLAVRGFV